jgi:hypothetical protein
MANVLTNLVPDLYAGLDTVSRELVGFIPAVARDSSAERAAVGQNVRYPIAPAGNAASISPAMAIPEPTDQTIGNGIITISKAKAAEFGFVGEEQRGLNTGPGFKSVQSDMFAQALRVLVNEIEADLALAAVLGASRAHGTVGTTPFASNMSDASQLRKILVDNGAPPSDMNLVIDSDAGANVHTLYGISTTRDWSTVPINQQGVLVTPYGMAVRESAGFADHVTGTAAGATTNNAGYAIGAVTLTLASAGTGTILTGDVITLAGDPNKYVVVTGDGAVGGGGTVVIQEPGLRQAIGASNTAITVERNVQASPDIDLWAPAGVAFYRNAIQLVTRAPAMPEEQRAGSGALLDQMTLVDPRSGLAFEVTAWAGYRKVRYEVALAWGYAVTQKRHTALLLR